MEAYLKGIGGVSRFMNGIAGVCLTFIMLLTTLDVILRLFKKPIVGTYELVGFMGGLIIGFAIPMTSWARGHIYVDFLIQKLPPSGRVAANVLTRSVVTTFFAVVAANLFRHGLYLYRTHEVSPTLQLPPYPVIFGLGVACLLECLVLIADIMKITKGAYE